ncbi:MAG TPA: hypothetical protein VKV79_01550 [Terriglobia bacterium]|nr:hypothetical protein [Terriglobia bacterium]
MTHSSRFTAILLGGLIFCGARWGNAALAAGTGQKNQKAPDLPSYWLSATTHNVYRVQVKGNVLMADWVNVPKAEAQRGAYIRTECHRVGKRWIGSTRSFLRCETESGNGKPYSNWCHILTRTQISSVSAGRIVGRAEALKRFDCRQCMALEKEWKSFIWSPAPLRSAPPGSGNLK